MIDYQTPKHVKERWMREDIAHIEFDRMKTLGASDRLALDIAIRAFERSASLTSQPACGHDDIQPSEPNLESASKR